MKPEPKDASRRAIREGLEETRMVTPEHPVYSTKYALTKGIQVHIAGDVKDGIFCDEDMWSVLRMNHDAWDSVEAAQADVKRRAQRKLQSLDKQRAKIEEILRAGVKIKDVT